MNRYIIQLFFLLTFLSGNYLNGQCIDHKTYQSGDQGNVPDLTKADRYVNAYALTIESGQNIAFESGEYSTLYPGFEAECGSEFSSFIIECIDDACTMECTNGNATQIDNIIRGPYMQNIQTINGDARAVIKWRVDEENDDYRIEICSGNAPSAEYEEGDSNGEVDFDKDDEDRTVSLHNLLPNTMYQYYIYNDDCNSNCDPVIGFFRTPPVIGSPIDDSDPLSVWVMGDAGETNGTTIEDMRDAYFDYTSDANDNDDDGNLNVTEDCSDHFTNTDYIFNLGDNAYGSGADQEMQEAIFDPYKKIMKYLPLWPTLGNHETNYGYEYAYYNAFDLPQNSPNPESYYSYDYGNVHFVSLNSQLDGNEYTAMADWLEIDLTQNQNAQWTILYFHTPVMSAGIRQGRSTYGPNANPENDFDAISGLIRPITNQFDIDLVMYGHNHAYERSYLVRCGLGDNGSGESSNLSNGTVEEDYYGDFEILDFGCVNNNNCDQYNSDYDDVLNKAAGADNGTVFITCGASSKCECPVCGSSNKADAKYDYFNHPAMKIFHEPTTYYQVDDCDDTATAGEYVVDGGRGMGEKADIGSMNLSITNDEIVGTYISKDGDILDQFTLIKSGSSNRVASDNATQLEKEVELTVYPNPFRDDCNVQFKLDKESYVSFNVLDQKGQLIQTLVDNERMSEGNHQLRFDSRDLPKGIYFGRLQTGTHVETVKMVIQ